MIVAFTVGLGSAAAGGVVAGGVVADRPAQRTAASTGFDWDVVTPAPPAQR
ncbi:hypothetical protein ACFYS8_17465 [Kitasatospora sp. NPDC004615]|uniref:hypothetical protein n=1 Tax=Kitasatospora sp. NPDC004615 TaxID=3364017 RepID=UPI00369ABDE0